MSAIIGHKRARIDDDQQQLDEPIDHSFINQNQNQNETKPQIKKKHKANTYIQLAETFNWNRVNFEKLRVQGTYKKVPLSINHGEKRFQGPMFQMGDVKMPYPPKIMWPPNGGSPNCELAVTIGDTVYKKFCDDGDAEILENAKKNRHIYFKKDYQEDRDIIKNQKSLSEIAWKKWRKDEHGQSQPVIEEGKYPDVMKFKIPLDKDTHEPTIQFIDSETGDKLSMEDLQGGCSLDVLGKMHCQWFNGNKFGVKPTATKICVISQRESYNDYEFLPEQHVKLAKSGEDIYENGKLKDIPKDDDNSDQDNDNTTTNTNENDQENDGFINSFGNR